MKIRNKDEVTIKNEKNAKISKSTIKSMFSCQRIGEKKTESNEQQTSEMVSDKLIYLLNTKIEKRGIQPEHLDFQCKINDQKNMQSNTPSTGFQKLQQNKTPGENNCNVYLTISGETPAKHIIHPSLNDTPPSVPSSLGSSLNLKNKPSSAFSTLSLSKKFRSATSIPPPTLKKTQILSQTPKTTPSAPKTTPLALNLSQNSLQTLDLSPSQRAASNPGFLSKIQLENKMLASPIITNNFNELLEPRYSPPLGEAAEFNKEGIDDALNTLVLVIHSDDKHPNVDASIDLLTPNPPVLATHLNTGGIVPEATSDLGPLVDQGLGLPVILLNSGGMMHEVDSGLDCLVPGLPALKTLLHSSDDERKVHHDTGLPTTEHNTGGVIGDGNPRLDLVELQLNSDADMGKVEHGSDSLVSHLNPHIEPPVNTVHETNPGLDLLIPQPAVLAYQLNPNDKGDVPLTTSEHNDDEAHSEPNTIAAQITSENEHTIENNIHVGLSDITSAQPLSKLDIVQQPLRTQGNTSGDAVLSWPVLEPLETEPVSHVQMNQLETQTLAAQPLTAEPYVSTQKVPSSPKALSGIASSNQPIGKTEVGDHDDKDKNTDVVEEVCQHQQPVLDAIGQTVLLQLSTTKINLETNHMILPQGDTTHDSVDSFKDILENEKGTAHIIFSSASIIMIKENPSTRCELARCYRNKYPPDDTTDSLRVTSVCDDKAIKPQFLDISGIKEVNNIQMNFIQEIPGLESSKANNLGLDIGKQVPIPGLLELHPGSVVDVVDKEMQPQILKLSKISVKLENENQTPPALASTKVADNIDSDTDSQRRLDSACILENDHAVKVKDSLTTCQPVLDESDSTNEPLAHHFDQDIEHKADLPVVTSHPSCPVLSLPLDSNEVEDSETQKIAHHTQRGTISLKTEFEIQPKTKIFPSPLNATISDTNSIKDISIDDNEIVCNNLAASPLPSSPFRTPHSQNHLRKYSMKFTKELSNHTEPSYSSLDNYHLEVPVDTTKDTLETSKDKAIMKFGLDFSEPLPASTSSRENGCESDILRKKNSENCLASPTENISTNCSTVPESSRDSLNVTLASDDQLLKSLTFTSPKNKKNERVQTQFK